MAKAGSGTVKGVLWDEENVVSVTEICGRCGVQVQTVEEMVEFGIIEPIDGTPARWQFAGTSLRRVTAAVRLQRDLGVNLAGVALVLDLLDELAEYRRRG